MEGMNVLVKKTKEEVSLETEETILDQKVEQVSSEESEPLVLDVDQLDGVGAVTKKKLETFGVTNLIDICVIGSREVS